MGLGLLGIKTLKVAPDKIIIVLLIFLVFSITFPSADAIKI